MVIETKVVYRAMCQHGVILEYDADDFKALIRGAIREMKSEYGHERYYTHGTCHIQYGVLTEVLDDSGRHWKWSFLKLRDICTIAVSSIDKKTFTFIERGDKLL